MRMVKLILALLLISSSVAVGGQSPANPTDMDSFRSSYEGALFAERAVRDFEEVEKRIGDLVSRLEREGEMTDKATLELMGFVQQLEQEYIIRWYGPPDDLKWGRSFSQPTSTQKNAGYDSDFREQTRGARQEYKTNSQ